MPTMRPQNVAHCLANFKRQAYENKELILILNNAEFDIEAVRRDVDGIPNVQVLHVEGRTTLGDCLNLGVEAASGEYVAKFDDDDHYGQRYISDSVIAASFSGADIVGKGMYFVYFESSESMALRENTPEHTFTSSTIAGGTLFIESNAARDFPFNSISLSEDTNFQRAANAAGCRIYAADRFNYVRVRMDQSSIHSWQITDAEFRRELPRLYTRTGPRPGDDLTPATVVVATCPAVLVESSWYITFER